MHKDPNLRRRDALVIPGGLLALLSAVGIVYVVALRTDGGTCGDAGLVVLAGACRSALLLLAIPLVVGLALLAVGAIRFRSRATCRLGHGSWAHFGLAFLIALFAVPAAGALASPYLVGQDAAIVSGNVEYPVTTVLAGLAGVGLVALVPFAALYTARNRANPCCHERGCFEPCFCDEGAGAAAPAGDAEAAPAAEAEMPAEEPQEAPAPAAMAGAPPAEPEPEWEVVEDEPAPPAPEPAPEEPAPARARAAAAAPPALATRPTDPAAPPQDAMAAAAKWAEEDAEAEAELRGEAPPRKPRAKPAKKAAKRKSGK